MLVKNGSHLTKKRVFKIRKCIFLWNELKRKECIFLWDWECINYSLRPNQSQLYWVIFLFWISQLNWVTYMVGWGATGTSTIAYNHSYFIPSHILLYLYLFYFISPLLLFIIISQSPCPKILTRLSWDGWSTRLKKWDWVLKYSNFVNTCHVIGF